MNRLSLQLLLLTFDSIVEHLRWHSNMVANRGVSWDVVADRGVSWDVVADRGVSSWDVVADR